MERFTDENGDYNFEGFTSLEAYCADQQSQYPNNQYVGLSWYHESGVTTIEQKIKWDIYGMISDASKELNGCRARFDWIQFSVEELYADYESYVRMIDEDNNYEENLKKANIQAMLDAGAPNEETAERWAQEDEYDHQEEQANMWNAQIQALEDEYHMQLEEVA